MKSVNFFSKILIIISHLSSSSCSCGGGKICRDNKSLYFYIIMIHSNPSNSNLVLLEMFGVTWSNHSLLKVHSNPLYEQVYKHDSFVYSWSADRLTSRSHPHLVNYDLQTTTYSLSLSQFVSVAFHQTTILITPQNIQLSFKLTPWVSLPNYLYFFGCKMTLHYCPLIWSINLL